METKTTEAIAFDKKLEMLDALQNEGKITSNQKMSLKYTTTILENLKLKLHENLTSGTLLVEEYAQYSEILLHLDEMLEYKVNLRKAVIEQAMTKSMSDHDRLEESIVRKRHLMNTTFQQIVKCIGNLY